MDYKCTVNKESRELKIIISGEPCELYKCGRAIVDICEGDESPKLRSNFDSSKDLTDVIVPRIVPIGVHGIELFTFSGSGLEYSFSLKGHSKDKIETVRIHYKHIKKELDKLMKYFNGKPSEYDSRFFE